MATTLRTARRQRGVTLVELMVGLTLGLVVTASMLMLFANASAHGQDVARAGMQIENGRYVSELLREDLRLAGFYGETSVAGALYTQPDPCSIAPAGWGGTPLTLPTPVQGYTPADALACLDQSQGRHRCARRAPRRHHGDRPGDDRRRQHAVLRAVLVLRPRRRDAAPHLQQRPRGPHPAQPRLHRRQRRAAVRLADLLRGRMQRLRRRRRRRADAQARRPGRHAADDDRARRRHRRLARRVRLRRRRRRQPRHLPDDARRARPDGRVVQRRQPQGALRHPLARQGDRQQPRHGAGIRSRRHRRSSPPPPTATRAAPTAARSA